MELWLRAVQNDASAIQRFSQTKTEAIFQIQG